MDDHDNHQSGQDDPTLPDIGKLKLVGTTLCLPDDEEGEMMIFAQLTGYWPEQLKLAKEIVRRLNANSEFLTTVEFVARCLDEMASDYKDTAGANLEIMPQLRKNLLASTRKLLGLAIEEQKEPEKSKQKDRSHGWPIIS